MKKLMKASMVWSDEVLDRVASRVFSARPFDAPRQKGGPQLFRSRYDNPHQRQHPSPIHGSPMNPIERGRNLVNQVRTGAEKAVNKVEHAVENTVHKVQDVAVDAGHKIHNVVDGFENKAVNGAKAVQGLFGGGNQPDKVYDGQFLGAGGQTFPPGTPLKPHPRRHPEEQPEPLRDDRLRQRHQHQQGWPVQQPPVDRGHDGRQGDRHAQRHRGHGRGPGPVREGQAGQGHQPGRGHAGGHALHGAEGGPARCT